MGSWRSFQKACGRATRQAKKSFVVAHGRIDANDPGAGPLILQKDGTWGALQTARVFRDEAVATKMATTQAAKLGVKVWTFTI